MHPVAEVPAPEAPEAEKFPSRIRRSYSPRSARYPFPPKNRKREKACAFSLSLVLNTTPVGAIFRLLSSEAVAAVDGAIVAGLKGDLAGLAALGADSVEHGAGGGAGLTLAGIAAALAALGFVGEAFFSIELLLTGGEHELLAALFAN